jgi:hypothetical protein
LTTPRAKGAKGVLLHPVYLTYPEDRACAHSGRLFARARADADSQSYSKAIGVFRVGVFGTTRLRAQTMAGVGGELFMTPASTRYQ